MRVTIAEQRIARRHSVPARYLADTERHTPDIEPTADFYWMNDDMRVARSRLSNIALRTSSD